MHKIKHLAIIMDGNRRWAKDHGLPSIEGHRRGYNKLKEVGEWALDRGVKYFTVYAFSTENWNRSKKEVDYLMKLLQEALTKELPYFMKKNIRLKVIGSRERLSEDLKKAINKAEKETANNSRGTLSLAINYGGRLELIEAVKKIIKKGVKPEAVTEEMISENIYTEGIPNPDLVIRTSGEHRLSGFLTWQTVYSELYFIKKHWPAFTEKDLEVAFEEFESRQRRYGK